VKTRGSLSPGVLDCVRELDSKSRGLGIALPSLAGELGISPRYHPRTRGSGGSFTIDISPAEPLPTLGWRLRSARVASGLSLKGAAEKIGYTCTSVARWEKDRCLPKPGVLLHLCRLYGVSFNMLRRHCTYE